MMWQWKKLALIVGMMLSAAVFACDDYCDSGWAGVYETGGYDFYQSAYDIYQTTVDVDITTTTYMPLYDTYGSSGGNCGGLLTTCGGGWDNPTLYNPVGTTYPSLGDTNLIPRDPMNPWDPSFDPIAANLPPVDPNFNLVPNVPTIPPFFDPVLGGLVPTPPIGGYIPRDPAVLPPVFPPVTPIGSYPGTPVIPPNNVPRTPVIPNLNTPVTPTPSLTGSLPNTSRVDRDPTKPYVPPSPPPWGGCDGVVVPCPGGSLTRPNGTLVGTPSSTNTVPGTGVVTNPTTNPLTPSTHTGGTTPQRNQVPRGARSVMGRR